MKREHRGKSIDYSFVYQIYLSTYSVPGSLFGSGNIEVRKTNTTNKCMKHIKVDSDKCHEETVEKDENR